MDNSKKILKNTFFLYGKSALTIFITMYSTRVLLSSLGAEDYGIFSIIFGFVSFVAFFQIAMSSASQRFISIFLGQNDLQNLNKVFNTTVLFHLIVAVVLCFILELIGLLFFEQLLNIPTAKMETAKIVYQFVVLVTFIKVNAVPYDAVIRANEDMGFIAILGILETILTLVIAFLISVLDNQKLIYYSFSYTLMVLLLRLLISFFSFKRYRYLSVKKEFLFQVYKAKDIFNYAKWNLFGSITALTKSQGLNYILNLFLGPVANSAYSISNQLNNQTIFFSRTIESTIKPQLFKTYGNNEKEKSK